jgi:quercetin dioxygenase-like cupin family protein
MVGRTREERAGRLYPDGIHTFHLAETAESLRAEAEFAANGRTGLTLVKGPELRVVLMVLQAGAGLAEHHAPGPITVHVLEGELRFSSAGEVIYLRPGELLALPSRQPHAVEAVHESAFLLTIAPEGAKGGAV